MISKIWIVLGHSESGDHYSATFNKKPSTARLSKLAHSWDGDDDKEGPGYDGSYVHIEVKESEVKR